MKNNKNNKIVALVDNIEKLAYKLRNINKNMGNEILEFLWIIRHDIELDEEK